MGYPVVKLAGEIDWRFNPYYQYFCGEQVFRHELPFDRSSLTRWRQRLGEEQVVALLQESLSVAQKTGAVEMKDLERLVADTTVQPKAVAHPTDARLLHRAMDKLADLARREGVALRQSYVRVAKRAAIMVGRYSHAHQFKRARRALKSLGSRSPAIRCGKTLSARCSRSPRRYAGRISARWPQGLFAACARSGMHGKGNAQAPYEFGCKVSIITPVTSPRGGQFVLHAKALYGNPYDGHTLGPVAAELEILTGVEAKRIHVDKGYRGHNYPNKFRVWISGQVKRVTAVIRREIKRRAAVEPVIGQVKADHRIPQLSQGSPG